MRKLRGPICMVTFTCAITLLGFTPVAIAVTPRITPSDHHEVVAPHAAATAATYVALGDSYASGEGLPDPGVDPWLSTMGKPTASKDGCDRSEASYPFLIAKAENTSFSFPACSGATTGSTYDPSSLTKGLGSLLSGKGGEASQLRSLSPTGTRIVTLSIGAADLGFPKLLKSCMGFDFVDKSKANIQPASIFSTPTLCAQAVNEAEHLASGTSGTPGRLEYALVNIYTRILAAAPKATLLVGTYPQFFTGQPSSGFCPLIPGKDIAGQETYVGLAAQQEGAISGLEDDLNIDIQAAGEAVDRLPGDIGRLDVVNLNYLSGADGLSCSGSSSPKTIINGLVFAPGDDLSILYKECIRNPKVPVVHCTNTTGENYLAAGTLQESAKGETDSAQWLLRNLKLLLGADEIQSGFVVGNQAVTSVHTGTSVVARASITGSNFVATGKVTFRVYKTGNCTGTVLSNTQDSLVGGVASSPPTPAPADGSYSMRAAYGGDVSHNAIGSSCNPLTVWSKYPPTVVTEILQSGTPVTKVAASSKVNLRGMVTGADGTATGSLQFNFYLTPDCTGTSTSLTGGTLTGGKVTSSLLGPLSAGTYSFTSTYVPTGNYSGATSSCTTLSVGLSSVDLTVRLAWSSLNGFEGEIFMPAVSGSLSGAFGAPTGTITLTLYSTGNCSGPGTLLAAPIYNYGTDYYLPLPLLPAGATYSVLANFSGDLVYNHDVVCSNPDVFPAGTSTSVSVVQNGNQVNSVAAGTAVTLQATVTSTTGPTPNLPVTFFDFQNADCGGAFSGIAFSYPGANQVGVSSTSGGVATFPISSFVAGTWSVAAIYNPGSGSAAVPSFSSCVTFTVTTVPTNLVTAVQQNGASVTSVAAGSSVTDQATVSGSFGPATGSVTFTFFENATCASPGTPLAPASPILDDVATSPSENDLAAGSYSFKASYDGEGSYEGSTSACEPFTVAPVAPTITSTVFGEWGSSGQIVVGPSLTAGMVAFDKDAVTGTAGPVSGTLTFTLFPNGTCTGNGFVQSPTSLSGGAADSNRTGVLGAGSYSFIASFTPLNPAANYAATSGACEGFTVNLTPANMDTFLCTGTPPPPGEVSPNCAQSVENVVFHYPVGTRLFLWADPDDAAYNYPAGEPTGVVQFAYFSDLTCTGTSTVLPSTALDVLGNGYSSVELPVTAGGYSFLASYGGDTNYSASPQWCTPFAALAALPTVSTTIQADGSNVSTVPAGTAVTDQATLSGPSDLPAPSGTVTFMAYPGTTCTGVATLLGTGALVSGVANSPSSFDPSTPGSYSILADYNSDASYSTSSGPCEKLTVIQAPVSISTEFLVDGSPVTSAPSGSSVTVQATVGSSNGLTPAGTVAFLAFTNSSCTGTGEELGSTVTLVGGVATSESFDATQTISYEADYVDPSSSGTFASQDGSCTTLQIT